MGLFGRASECLSEQALDNMKLYRYSAVDKSPVSKYILKPYWEWATTLFPMWMAPNLITLVGFSFVWINLLFLLIWVPDLKGPASPWLYFSFAIGIWLYSTFDNVDGKQARRTGSSSPLGELFDHGCDALNCSVGALVQAASLGLGFTWYSGMVAFFPTIAFYFSTWEEYHTGTLYLGYVNGPTEGLIIACIMSIISGIIGPEIWMELTSNVLPSALASIFPSWFKLIDIITVGMTVLLLTFHIPFSLVAVYKSCRLSQHKSSFIEALTQLIPMGVFLTSAGVWLASPYSDSLSQHYILFIMANGIVFGRMATKIILAHVTKMPFPLFSTGLLIPLIIGAILVNIPRLTGSRILTPRIEAAFIWIYFIIAAVNYLHWAVMVIEKLCQHLGIECFSLKRRPSPRRND